MKQRVTVNIDKKVMDEVRKLLKDHPEYRSVSHYVEYAIRLKNKTIIK